MQALADAGDIQDISGQPDTNVGNMLSRIRQSMQALDPDTNAEVHITDPVSYTHLIVDSGNFDWEGK